MLLRFRIHNVAIVADIKQAFLQISVKPQHRDFLRFLWWDDVFSESAEVIKIRFCRVLFGGTPSQFLLNGVVKVHVEKYKDIDPEFVRKTLSSMYVDDLNSGVKTTADGITMYKKWKERFGEAGLELRKWRTNDEKLRLLISNKYEENGEQKVLEIRTK